MTLIRIQEEVLLFNVNDTSPFTEGNAISNLGHFTLYRGVTLAQLVKASVGQADFRGSSLISGITG